MKVLFLMFAFPDMNTSFNMYTTIVEEFSRRGFETYIVAPGKGTTAIIKENGIDILRVKTLPIKNVPNYIKGISNLLLPYQFGRALEKHYPNIKFDLIITPTPPITLVDLAVRLKKKHGAFIYLILRDIFPQNAIDLGFIKQNGLLHKYFRSKEEKLYNEADYIGCMSMGNINYIMKNNPEVQQKKIHELKNFQKLYLGSDSDTKDLKDKYHIEGKYVVVFGGNMGKPQQLENVLELAKSCDQLSDVLFLLIGEGLHITKLKYQIKNYGINNILIHDTISKADYQDLISVCDVGLISLHENFTIPNIPSKSLDYFNVGLPILASIDNATDFGEIIDSSGAGLWSLAGDHQTFKNNFDTLYFNSDLRKQMGIKGREYFENNLTPEIAFRAILSAIKS